MTHEGKNIRATLARVDWVEAKASDGNSDGPKRFTMEAYNGGLISQAWSDLPMVVDLQGLKIPERNIPIRLDHDTRQGVGHADSVRAEGGKLYAEGAISRATDAARDVQESARMGFTWQASISASISRAEEVADGTVEVNGRSFDAPVLVIRASELREISFVDLGADDTTTARVAASQAKGPNMADTPNSGLEAGKAESETTTKSPAVHASSVTEDLEAMRTHAKADAKRRSSIMASAKSVIASRPEMADAIIDAAHKAIDTDMAASDFELECMRTKRDFGDSINARRSDESPSDSVLEAALCMAGGMKDDELEASFAERDLELASRKYGKRLGLSEIIMLAASAHGHHAPSVKFDTEGALRAAFRPGRSMIEAGSTISLPNILSNVANKFVLRGFNSVEQTWSQITKVGTARDFKQKSTNTLVGDYNMKQLAPSGKIEHAVPGERNYTNQIDTYARMLTIDRRHIINDDLDALTEAPSKIGRGGALALNEDFWAKFLDDSSIFTVGNGNSISGASTALSITSVTTLLNTLMDQTDPDGKPLGLRPSDLILLTPYELMNTAKQIVNSTEVRDPSASAAFGTINPHAGLYDLAHSVYLTDATAWYLIVKPEVLPLIATDFLNGNTTPTLESADADFDEMGISFRGYYDFGTSYQEYRAGAKSAGA